MSHTPILYSFRRCPYAMRARLAVASAQRQVELREIVLRDKAPEFLEASPKATVPVLVSDDQILEESLDIMMWSLAQHDPEGWLAGHDPALIADNDGPFKSALDHTKYASRYPDLDRGTERAKAAAYLSTLNDRLAQSPYLSGANFGLNDAAIAPFVRQFAFIDKNWFDAQPWPELHRWLEAFLASDRFAGIMQKHPKWQKGDPVTRFPSS